MFPEALAKGRQSVLQMSRTNSFTERKWLCKRRFGPKGEGLSTLERCRENGEEADDHRHDAAYAELEHWFCAWRFADKMSRVGRETVKI